MDNQQLSITLHLMLCKRMHVSHDMNLAPPSGDRNEYYCYFYIERQMEDCWDMPDHKKWLEVADKIRNLVDIEDDAKFRVFMSKLLNITSQIEWLKSHYPSSLGLTKLFVSKALESFKTSGETG
jgi:hypothetical protein